MNPENDHWSAMTHLEHELRSSRNRDLDTLGNGGSALSQDLQDVAAFLTQLRRLADRPAPPPSAQLASLLARGFTPDVPTTPTTRKSTRPTLSAWLRRGALAFGLSAGLSASLVGAAAASGQLPDGAQDVLERLVETVTPFEVHDQRSAPPRGDDRGPQTPVVGDEPDVPLTKPQQATSPDEPDGDGTTTVGKRSKDEDAPSRTREDESGSQRSDDGDIHGGRESDHEGSTAGDDGGPAHELSSGGTPEEASSDPSSDSGSDPGSGTSPAEGSDPGAEHDLAD